MGSEIEVIKNTEQNFAKSGFIGVSNDGKDLPPAKSLDELSASYQNYIQILNYENGPAVDGVFLNKKILDQIRSLDENQQNQIQILLNSVCKSLSSACSSVVDGHFPDASLESIGFIRAAYINELTLDRLEVDIYMRPTISGCGVASTMFDSVKIRFNDILSSDDQYHFAHLSSDLTASNLEFNNVRFAFTKALIKDLLGDKGLDGLNFGMSLPSGASQDSINQFENQFVEFRFNAANELAKKSKDERIALVDKIINELKVTLNPEVVEKFHSSLKKDYISAVLQEKTSANKIFRALGGFAFLKGVAMPSVTINVFHGGSEWHYTEVKHQGLKEHMAAVYQIKESAKKAGLSVDDSCPVGC